MWCDVFRCVGACCDVMLYNLIRCGVCNVMSGIAFIACMQVCVYVRAECDVMCCDSMHEFNPMLCNGMTCDVM